MEIKEKYRILTKLSMPVMISYLAYQLLGFTDILMVGQLGKDAITSVGLALTFFFFIFFPVDGLLESVTILIAKNYGKKDLIMVKKIFKNALVVCVAAGLIAMIAYIPMSFILDKMSQTDEIAKNSKIYLLLSLFGIIPQCATGIINRLFLGCGKTKPIAIFSNMIVIINIILTYCLVFGKLGFPQMGVAGSALGTLIAKLIGFIMAFIYYLKIRRKILNVNEKVKISSNTIKEIMKTGYPVAQTNFIEITAWTVFIAVINKYGSSSMAAHEIGMKIKDIAYLPGSALGIVVTNLAGNFLGEKDYEKVKEYTYAAVKSAVFIMGIFGIIFFIFPHFLVSMFTKDKEVLELGSHILRIMALYQITDAVFIVFKGVLNGINDTKYVRNYILIGSWVIMVPISFILAVVFKLGVIGAWVGLTIYVTVIGMFYFARFRKRYINKFV